MDKLWATIFWIAGVYVFGALTHKHAWSLLKWGGGRIGYFVSKITGK